MKLSDQFRADLIANNPLRTGVLGMVLGWFFEPGFRCATLIRVQLALRSRSLLCKIISKMCARRLLREFSTQVSNGCSIGSGLRLPHPIGIVVGKGVLIGDRVTIYQHVTLGTTNMLESSYPSIGADSVLYAGCVVIGNITVGERVIVGANAVVSKPVPSGYIAAGNPAHVRFKK